MFTQNFTVPADAQAFGLSLKNRGITCQVRVNQAQPEQCEERPDSSHAEAEIKAFEERGEELGGRALAWAKSSLYYEGDLAHAVACLSSDIDDGIANGAASLKQAALFIKRLQSALSRAPKKSVVTAAAKPASWDIVWHESVETGHARDAEENEAWGSSIGSDGWRCD